MSRMNRTAGKRSRGLASRKRYEVKERSIWDVKNAERSEAWLARQFTLLGQAWIREAFLNRPPVALPPTPVLLRSHPSVRLEITTIGESSLEALLARIGRERFYLDTEDIRRRWANARLDDLDRQEIVRAVEDSTKRAGLAKAERYKLIDTLLKHDGLVEFILSSAVAKQRHTLSALDAAIAGVGEEIARVTKDISAARSSGLDEKERSLRSERVTLLERQADLRRQRAIGLGKALDPMLQDLLADLGVLVGTA